MADEAPKAKRKYTRHKRDPWAQDGGFSLLMLLLSGLIFSTPEGREAIAKMGPPLSKQTMTEPSIERKRNGRSYAITAKLDGKPANWDYDALMLGGMIGLVPRPDYSRSTAKAEREAIRVLNEHEPLELLAKWVAHMPCKKQTWDL